MSSVRFNRELQALHCSACNDYVPISRQTASDPEAFMIRMDQMTQVHSSCDGYRSTSLARNAMSFRLDVQRELRAISS